MLVKKPATWYLKCMQKLWERPAEPTLKVGLEYSLGFLPKR